MKNVFLLFALVCSTSLFAQNKFDGQWIYEPSDYILNIQTKNNKLFLHNPEIKDTLHKTIVHKNEKEILSRVTTPQGCYDVKYEFLNNQLIATFPFNYKITYKKLQL